jgi:hypothetical protein
VRVVAVNFASDPRPFGLSGSWIVELASDAVGEGTRYRDGLATEQALLLRPA